MNTNQHRLRLQLEDGVLVMGVEQQQERVAFDREAVAVAGPGGLAVEKDAERAMVRVLPVAPGHAPPVEAEPPDVGQARLGLLAGEEVLGVLHRADPLAVRQYGERARAIGATQMPAIFVCV